MRSDLVFSRSYMCYVKNKLQVRLHQLLSHFQTKPTLVLNFNTTHQLNIQLINTHSSKDHLCVTYHIFWVSISAHFQLDPTTILITTESPKSRFLNALNAMELCDLNQFRFF